MLTPGQVSDHAGALPLLSGLSATHVIADKAYDAHLILDAIEQAGAAAVIPQRRGWHRPRAFDPGLYRLRNRIERTIGRLKHFRRVATRYDRLPENYLAALHLAAIAVWL